MLTPIKGPSWEREATLRRVLDGDTMQLNVDVGFDHDAHPKFRLFMVNAPEKTGKTKVAGLRAMAFVTSWFADKPLFLVRTYKASPEQEKYGRWLVEVWSLDGKSCLNQELIASGNAEPMTADGSMPKASP